MKPLKVFSLLSNSSAAEGSIVLLHGYGANGKDLMGMASYAPLKQLNYDWYFLEAPLSPPDLAIFGGKAWFNLTVREFRSDLSSEGFQKFYQTPNPDFSKSLELIQQSIWELDLKTNVNLIGGFSQGAMMAAHVFLGNQDLWSGAAFMSGAPYQSAKWPALKKEKPVFLSHGEQDPVLPSLCGKDFISALENAGLKPQKHWFQGGHGIPIEVLQKLSQFMTKLT